MTRKSVSPSLADVVERADVRMAQLRDRLRFALEPCCPRDRPRDARQDLDGDRAIQAGVARLVDLAHAAGADGATIS